MRCLDREPQPVLGDERLERVDGGRRPRLDALFFDVHVNVEHTAARFERQQARLPHRFARGKKAEMTAVGQPLESKKRDVVVPFVDGQAFK